MANIKVPSIRFHKPRNTFCVDLPMIGSPARRVYFNTADDATGRDRYHHTIAEWLKAGRRTVPSLVWPSRAAADAAPAPSLHVPIARVCACYLNVRRKRDRTTAGRFAGDDLARVSMRRLRDAFPYVDARELNASHLEDFQQGMIDDRLALSTLKKTMYETMRALRTAAKARILPAAIVHECALVDLADVRTPNVKPAVERLPVDDAAFAQTLPFCTPSVRAILTILRNCGCRPSELFRTRPIDLDRSRPVWRITLAEHKTAKKSKRPRVIMLNGKAIQALAPFLNGPVHLPIFSPARHVEEARATRHAARKTPMNAGHSPGTNRVAKPQRVPGDRWHSAAFAKVIRGSCKAAKVTPWTAYELRHAFLTDIRAAAGLEAAAVVAGHSASSMRMTEGYARPDLDAASRAVALVG